MGRKVLPAQLLSAPPVALPLKPRAPPPAAPHYQMKMQTLLLKTRPLPAQACHGVSRDSAFGAAFGPAAPSAFGAACGLAAKFATFGCCPLPPPLAGGSRELGDLDAEQSPRRRVGIVNLLDRVYVGLHSCTVQKTGGSPAWQGCSGTSSRHPVSRNPAKRRQPASCARWLYRLWPPAAGMY